MTLVDYGSVNTTALTTPDVLVQRVKPSIALIAGVATNVIGIVGTASGMPVGVPMIFGSPEDYAKVAGPVMARSGDIGTILNTAYAQGANAFVCVRVTDTTDTAATVTTKGVTLTAKASGSFYNSAQLAIGTGSKNGTLKAIIAIPGAQATTYDNLPTGVPFWAALAAAAAHDPLVAISVGGSPSAPDNPSTVLLAGGTDGASGVTSTTMVGSDTNNARSGMYALRGKGCAQIVLADAVDASTWSTQAAFASSEGALAVITNADGSLSTAVNARCDFTAAKPIIGDKVLWNDPANGARYVSPQGFYAGLRASLAPNVSTLNKPIVGVAGTQRNGNYSKAEQLAYQNAGWDILGTGFLGSSSYTMASGLNGSSDATVWDETYTTMTNSIALSLGQAVRQYIGLPNTDDLRNNVASSINTYLARYVTEGLLSRTPNGKMPFIVTCDATNNSQADAGLGFLRVTVQVTLAGTVRNIVVNLQDGSTQVTNA